MPSVTGTQPSQVLSIRRQLDVRGDTVSLRRLLADIARHPRVASRERHVSIWIDNGVNQVLKEEAHRNFDRFSGDRGRDWIDATLVRADVEKLRAVGAVAERYANEVLAHTALRQTHSVPTYADLNAAIDQIGALVKKYASLLTATVLTQLEPVIQEDWMAPFRQPWIPPEMGQ